MNFKAPRVKGLNTEHMGELEAMASHEYVNWMCLFCGGLNEQESSVLCSGCRAWFRGPNKYHKKYWCWEFVKDEYNNIYYGRFMIAGDLFLEVFGEQNDTVREEDF